MLLNVLKRIVQRRRVEAPGAVERDSVSLQHGLVLEAEGQIKAAEAVYRLLLARNANDSDAAHLLGVLLDRSDRTDEAIPFLEVAAGRQPQQAEVALHLGSAYQRIGRIDDAENAFRRAIAMAPELVAAHANLGILLKDRGRLDEGRSAIEAGLALQPDSAELWYNLGILQRELGDPRHARRSFEKALQKLPEFSEARFGWGLALLAIGEFADGWPAYETRLQLQRFASDTPPVSLPSWDGEATDDEVLVYGEQGIGDEIMFASCLSELMKRCPNVVLICSDKLHALLQASFPMVRVIPRSVGKDRSLPGQSSRMVALGTLPLHFRNSPGDFPGHTGYLRPDPTLVAEYRQRIAALGTTLKVGISWRGGTHGTGRAFRSVDVALLMAALNLPSVSLVNLQYDVDPSASEIEPYVRGGALVHWPEALDDYTHTAALVAGLDVVVSVCTAAIHLAGALGRPTFVMAPFNAEWRYGCEGTKMLWYPSVRIFRQSAPFDWGAVLSEVREQLIARGETLRSERRA